jgi:hypothetical protein
MSRLIGNGLVNKVKSVARFSINLGNTQKRPSLPESIAHKGSVITEEDQPKQIKDTSPFSNLEPELSISESSEDSNTQEAFQPYSESL